MDPNANLIELRGLVAQVLNENAPSLDEYDVDRLAELFESLDLWVSSGGFLPKEWEARRKP